MFYVSSKILKIMRTISERIVSKKSKTTKTRKKTRNKRK